MIHFIVGIGQYEYHSDDGKAWLRTLREVPSRFAPNLLGDVDIANLPVRTGVAMWDLIQVLPSGFGIAAGHDVLDKDRRHAILFRTNDSGATWTRVTMSLRNPPEYSWPAERFCSLVMSDPRIVVLSWQDPWLLESPQSHVVFSQDQGGSWDYSALGTSNPYLVLSGRGQIWALNGGYFMESSGLGSAWHKSEFRVEWPDGHRREESAALLRHVVFCSENHGFALLVHWPTNFIPELPTNVGLVCTEDGGTTWKHLHVFEGPNFGDVNERHALHLRIANQRIVREKA